MFRRLLSIFALLAVFSSASLPVAVIQFGVWVKMMDGFYEQKKIRKEERIKIKGK